MSLHVTLHCGVCAKDGPTLDPEAPDPDLGDWVVYGALLVCPDCDAHTMDEPSVGDKVRYVAPSGIQTGTVTFVGKDQIDVLRLNDETEVRENVADYPRWVLPDGHA